LSSGCASTGWVDGVLAEHSWILACFPERAQQEVRDEDPLAPASSSPAPPAARDRVNALDPAIFALIDVPREASD
jgi:hypothetical protein